MMRAGRRGVKIGCVAAMAACLALEAGLPAPTGAEVRFRASAPSKSRATPRPARPAPSPAVDAIPLTALPPEALFRTKAATVFIRVETKKEEVQGTGFFALQRGLVLTNAHVATPEHAVTGKLRVILNSGTRAERSLPAEVIASDPALDLAVLQVSGANLPEPLPLSGAAHLLETTPLYLFGFPFGDGLAAQGRNPEPSVLRASVACLRHTAEGALDVIQLDGELHPGNSGGPVVDAFGRVVGITASRLRSTRIGFAIPGERVVTLLEKQARALKQPAACKSDTARAAKARSRPTRRSLDSQVRSRSPLGGRGGEGLSPLRPRQMPPATSFSDELDRLRGRNFRPFVPGRYLPRRLPRSPEDGPRWRRGKGSPHRKTRGRYP